MFVYFTLGEKIELRRVTKQLKLQSLPKVFIMHLKRFSLGHIVTKNSTYIRYPLNIDVAPYCAEVRIWVTGIHLLTIVCGFVTCYFIFLKPTYL